LALSTFCGRLAKIARRRRRRALASSATDDLITAVVDPADVIMALSALHDGMQRDPASALRHMINSCCSAEWILFISDGVVRYVLLYHVLVFACVSVYALLCMVVWLLWCDRSSFVDRPQPACRRQQRL
jgi:hypothetical protein